MEFAWTGFDCASGDNPLNTSIRTKWRPESAEQYEKQIGNDLDEVFPDDDLFVMHKVPFRTGITHVENLGGDLGKARHQRCLIGAFPIPIGGRRGVALPRRRVRRGRRRLTATGLRSAGGTRRAVVPTAT